MPLETVPGSDVQYYFIAYDKDGKERRDDPAAVGGLFSEQVKKELEQQAITDVFLISHGWMQDVPAGKEQCSSWISAMLSCKEDREKVRQVRAGFRLLLIGLHWPSLPWGDEELSASSMSFSPQDDPVAPLVEKAAVQVADSDKAKEALRIIFTAALEDISPSALPPEVADAYKTLQQEAGLAPEGPDAAPGADADCFDPELIYQEAEDSTVSFGFSSFLDGLLAPLRTLSFWKMKDRARKFGERGAASLLRELQQAAGGRDVHFHLMGHSFGCIVASAAAAGASMPVHSMFLVQGALSLWSYCKDIPVAQGKGGYFHSIVSNKKVAGPIVTTLSEYDTANRVFYPRGTGVRGQVSFAPGELPKYGAIGCFGIHGPGLEISNIAMLPSDKSYNFQGGQIYNLDSSGIIRNGGGPKGAHSDIAHPEVAHAFWEAVMA